MLRTSTTPVHALTLTLALALAGCGDADGGTHGGSHSGGGGTDGGSTGAATSAASTDASATAGGTTAAVSPPAAPTDLAGSILDGGVHLTWKDASDNEDNFVLENKAAGDADFKVVIELPFDSVTYHDIAVTAGTTYTYRVKAVNAGGESSSNEIMVQVP